MELGDTLLKSLVLPGGFTRRPMDIAAYASGKLGNYIHNNYFKKDESNNTNTAVTNTPVKSQVETFNKRYPGFNEADYNRLVEIADSTGKTGTQKDQLMDELYQYYYPQVLNHHKLDERQEVINNWVYSNGENLANGDRETNAKYRLISLSQMAKQKFDIAYNVNDAEVVNALTNDIENGKELLRKYLNNGDTEILYAAGIYDKGEEAPDFRSQKDIAKEALGENYWKNVWDKMYTNSFAPLDSWEKKLYTLKKNMKNHVLDAYAGLVGQAPKAVQDYILGDMTYEEFMKNRMAMKEEDQKKIDNYINLVNETTNAEREKRLNPEMDNYYNRRNFTDLLAEGDIGGFFYKAMGDVASNWDMPVIIATSVTNPAAGTVLMGTNSYVRESQEAYETMRNAGATHEQAEIGGSVVGLVNTAIEIYLDKALGGVESTSSKGFREALKKNVMEEVQKKPFEEIVASASKKYVQSSLEEGLEEWLQNLVTNAAEMTVKENPEWKDLFEGGRASFEGGVFNPMNLVSGFSDVAQNKESIKQSMLDGATEAGYMARDITDTLGITKDGTTNTEGNVNTQGNVAVEGTEMVTPQGTVNTEGTEITTPQGAETTVDETVTDMDNGAIELIDEETTTENNTNTDLAETQGGSKFWEAVSGLEDNIKEKIKRNPYAIEESRELIKNMEDNPGLDFTEYQNERYESVLDMIEERLKQAEDKRRNDVGGLYTKLEEANAPIDTTNLKNRVAEYQARVEELGDILSSSDKAKIETILKNIQEIGDGTMDIWKVRKIADQWAKYDQGATGDGIRLIREIRNAIDDEIMAQNPEMKEVDQAYKKAKDEIQDLRGNLTYKKTGEIKSNAVSTVKNMLNANNKKYLSTLEKYIPGITERLQAIRDSKLVYNAYTSGEGSRFVSKGRDFVTKGILAGGGYLLGGPLGAGIGYLISGKVDAAITKLARKGLKETITKETPESRAELERINKKIEENQRLEAEEKAKLRELGDRIMQKVATMDKTAAEQSAWESYLADLEQDEVIDMPEEVYDQWEEVTTTPKKKTAKKGKSKKS